MKFSPCLLTFVAGASLCGFGQNPSYQLDPQWRAPAAATVRPNPLADKPEAAALWCLGIGFVLGWKLKPW